MSVSMGVGRHQELERVALGCKRTNNERNHACAIATSGLKALDELLDLPDLDLQNVVSIGARYRGAMPVGVRSEGQAVFRQVKRTFFSASFCKAVSPQSPSRWLVASAGCIDGEGESFRKRDLTYSLCVTHFEGVVDAEATFSIYCMMLQLSYLCLVRYPGRVGF